MKSSAKKVELASVDDLFSTEESRADAQREKIVEIPLTELISELLDMVDEKKIASQVNHDLYGGW